MARGRRSTAGPSGTAPPLRPRRWRLRSSTGKREGALWRAFARLSERCKTLLRLLIADEEPSYEEVGAALGMPVGAIGPTRMRCLDKLRRTTEIAKLEA